MAGILQIRRSHGILSGVILALLGIWGGLIPFVGPYFNYAYTPDTTWTYNTGRLWLEILPGAAAVLGGLLLIIASGRHIALFGALLGIVSGAWFAVGNVLAPLWTTANPAGVPASVTTVARTVEQIGFFTGLGVAIVLVAAFAAGRTSAVPGVRALTSVPTESLDRGELVTRAEPIESETSETSETSDRADTGVIK
jgi:hypothetical protein